MVARSVWSVSAVYWAWATKYPPYEFVVQVLLHGEYSFQLHVPFAQAASDNPKTTRRLVAITTNMRANLRRPVVRVLPSDANGSSLPRTDPAVPRRSNRRPPMTGRH